MPIPEPVVEQEIPSTAPDTPGKYLVRDEFGDITEETVIFTGVKLRKPTLRFHKKVQIKHAYADGPCARSNKKASKKQHPKVVALPALINPCSTSLVGPHQIIFN